MNPMTQVEIEAFLQAPRHAVVGTNPVDGPPQLSPVWYLWDGERLYISITTNTVKHHHLKRDPRISVCIDGCYPDFRTVIIYGTAEVIGSGEPLQEEMRWRIIRRYYKSEEEARRYAEGARDEPSVLIVVTPQKTISQDYN
mgnify:CR=1 FL=1